MAKRIKVLLTIFFTYLSIQTYSADKHTIAVFTDQPESKAAKEYVELMQKTFPFNVYEIDYKIVSLDPKDLPCKVETDYKSELDTSGNKVKASESSIKCNDDLLIEKTQKLKAQQAMVIKTDAEFAGSGGSIGIITTATPVSALMHEYLHVLGFCDEYEYKVKDADTFCKEDGNVESGVNSVIISPKDSYIGDSEARRLHWSKIKWNKLIENRTPITNSNGTKLGTGDIKNELTPANITNNVTTLDDPIGLYRGKVCKNATKPIIAWHPGGRVTIMENHIAGLGQATEKLVMKILDAKGIKRKANAPEKEDDDEDFVAVAPKQSVKKSKTFYGEKRAGAQEEPTRIYDQRDPFKALGEMLKDAIYGNGSKSQ